MTAVLAIMVGVVAAGAGPANAAGTATISRDIYLAAESSGAATIPSEHPRSIYLAAGSYTYGYTMTGPNGSVQDSRNIYLAAGWYYWQCVLAGTSGVYPAQDNYAAYCGLRLQSGSQWAYVPNNGNVDYWDLEPGTWHWVGYLTEN
jgi:hypothetical protein